MSRNASETRTPSPQQLATPQIFLDSDPISAKENLCIGFDLTSQIYHTWRIYHWQSPSSFLVGVIRHVAVIPQSSSPFVVVACVPQALYALRIPVVVWPIYKKPWRPLEEI